MKFTRSSRLFWRPASLLALVICLLGRASLVPSAAASLLSLNTVYIFDQGTYPSALVYGPEEAFWLTLKNENAVGRLNLDLPEPVRQVSLPVENSLPFDVTIGPDANLWFTERGSGKIGRVQAGAEYELAEFPLENPASQPSQMVLGQDGGLWFTEFQGNRIGRIGADHTILEYTLPGPASQPHGIVSDQEGILWFTEWFGNHIGRIDHHGNITEYNIPGGLSRPTEITLGPDGNLWFVTGSGQKLVRVIPSSGEMTSYTLSTGNASFLDLASGPDGKLWLLGTNTIVRLTLPPSTSSVAPPIVEATLPLDEPVYESEGRSQIIAGPGAEMHLINANSQNVQRVSIPEAESPQRDLQVFIHPYPQVMLMSGPFEVTIEVVNWSSLPAQDIHLTIPLPETVSYLEAQSPRFSCAAALGAVDCTFNSSPAGNDLDGGERLVVPFFFNFGRVGEAFTARQFDVFIESDAHPDYLPANNHAFRTLTFQHTIDYFNDFSIQADSHWSHTTLTSPDGALQYLGGFDNQRVTLTFSNLPHHDRADLCFDLYVLGAWDGAQLVDPLDQSDHPAVIGPDFWASYIDQDKLWMTTFSNRPQLTQSYPAVYNEGIFPAQTGAAEVDSFSVGGTVTDSRYHFCASRTHSGAELKYTFYGANLDGLEGEQWALDNVSMRLFYYNVFDRYFLPQVRR